MAHSTSKKFNINNIFPEYESREFRRQVAVGIARAPIERSIALKEFWSMVFGSRH